MSSNSEKIVLSALFFNSKLFPDVRKYLCANDFRDLMHQKIFQRMESLYEQFKRFDFPMMLQVDYGDDYDDYEKNMDIWYFYELIKDGSSKENINPHVQRIREQSVRRQLTELDTRTEAFTPEICARYLEKIATEIREGKHCCLDDYSN